MTSKHECKWCGSSFNSKGALQQHMRAKHQGRYLTYHVLPIVLVVLAALGGALAIYDTQQSGSGSHTHSETATYPAAPDFVLKRITAEGLTDETFRFSATRGKPVFMDFMFSWCPHCNNMAPIIKKLHEDYAGRGVYFLTVAGNDARTNEKLTAEFLERHGVSWTAVFDEELRVFNLYSVRGTPTYVAINSDGEIVGRLIGEQSYGALSSLIEKAMSG